MFVACLKLAGITAKRRRGGMLEKCLMLFVVSFALPDSHRRREQLITAASRGCRCGVPSRWSSSLALLPALVISGWFLSCASRRSCFAGTFWICLAATAARREEKREQGEEKREGLPPLVVGPVVLACINGRERARGKE